MPATGRKLTRRSVIASAAASIVAAAPDPRADIVDLFSLFASSITEKHAGYATDVLLPEMERYSELTRWIYALSNEWDTTSSIDILDFKADGDSAQISLDWLLTVKALRETTASTRRRRKIESRLVKRGRKWRIASLEPLDFFQPPAN